MTTVVPARSALARLWARLWAALAVACVLSLAGTSVASAMDRTAELGAPGALAFSAAATDVAAAAPAGQQDPKPAPVKAHCALCCISACASIAATAPALPAPVVRMAAPIPALDRPLPSSSLSTQDQPPRA